MNSRERFIAAVEGRECDFPPLAHMAALTTVELQNKTGCRMPDVHSDPQQLARLCFANHEVLGFDAVTFIINYFNEPAALGCKMKWGDMRQLPSYDSHPWEKEENAYVPEDLLDRPPVSTYLKTLAIAKRDYGKRVAVLGKIMGPLSMVQVMHGIENTMVGMIENPERIAYFLEIAADILARCAVAQFEAGIDALGIGEGGAGSNMVSPSMHEKFLLPVHKKMISGIPGPTIMHICGDISPRLGLLAQTGFTCFNFDHDINPSKMKEISRGKFRIMGNVSTTDLLRGSPADIEKQVMENMEAGVDIISPGCAVSPECQNENFKAMARAIRNRKRN